MAIKDVFTIIKADRYTKDGCEEIKKAKETLAEDTTYNIGDISQKTGLMKTANGWVEPKKAKAQKGAAKELANMNHFEEQKKADAKAKRDEKLRIERQEGEARADDFRKKVESGEIVYNKETGKFEEGNKPTNKPKASTEQKSAGSVSVGSTVKFKRSGQPIKVKKIENYDGTPIIVGEYDYNGKKETNRFRMDEISTDSAPRQLTGDCKIRIRK